MTPGKRAEEVCRQYTAVAGVWLPTELCVGIADAIRAAEAAAEARGYMKAVEDAAKDCEMTEQRALQLAAMCSGVPHGQALLDEKLNKEAARTAGMLGQRIRALAPKEKQT